jgi:hypothetical protein
MEGRSLLRVKGKSTLTSSGDGRQGCRSVVTLAGESLEAIFHLTVQLSWVPETSLASSGIRQVDADAIVSVIRSLRVGPGDWGGSKLDIVREGNGRPDEPSGFGVEPGEALGQATIRMSESMLDDWRIGLEFTVTSWLGERELFLRTGYHLVEAQEVISKLSF